MTQSDAINTSGVAEPGRRARVVILGEFSAGKSTLINLFTGGENLRTQVTATQMPPVWISHGTGDPVRVDLAGNEHPVDPRDPESISVTDTLYVRTFMQAPLLEVFDLIDTPGNSDPNIPSVAWERAAELADIAVWCSPSTQAWRQSELSAWREVPESVRERSILLLTRADKLTTDEDRSKVLKRVKNEAGGLFTHVHMASLLELDNTRDVLADLVALADSVTASDQEAANKATPNVSALLDDPSGNASSTKAPSAPVKDRPEVTNGEMTDDMLIDSLDLSGDADLDALVFDADDDTDMDEVLAALTSPVPAVSAITKAAASTESVKPTVAKTDSADVEPQDRVSDFDTAPVAGGFASELWRTMSATIPHDDADAYAAAFDLFLEKVDTEIATLRGQLNMKAAG